MKKTKTKLQVVVLSLMLLGGCVSMEGCEAFYLVIGTLTSSAAETTLSLTYVSRALIYTIHDQGNVAAITTLVNAGDGWYEADVFDMPISLKCTDSAGSPQVISGLPDLSNIEIFSIKMAGSDSGGSSDIQLSWSNPSATPTANGTMTYTASDGSSCDGTFTNLTYDAVSSSTSTQGYPSGGSSTMVWTTGDALLSNFTVVLTYGSDCAATGTVGLNASSSGLGDVSLAVVAGGFVGAGAQHYTISLVDSNDVTTDITPDVATQ